MNQSQAQQIGATPAVVISGTPSKMGRAVAHALAREGEIAIVTRNGEAVKGVKKEVEELGGSASVLPLNEFVDLDARQRTKTRNFIFSLLGCAAIFGATAFYFKKHPLKKQTIDRARRKTKTVLSKAVEEIKEMAEKLPDTEEIKNMVPERTEVINKIMKSKRTWDRIKKQLKKAA